MPNNTPQNKTKQLLHSLRACCIDGREQGQEVYAIYFPAYPSAIKSFTTGSCYNQWS